MVWSTRYDPLYYQIRGSLSSFAATAVDAIKDPTVAVQDNTHGLTRESLEKTLRLLAAANELRISRWLSVEHPRRPSISLLGCPNGFEQAYQNSTIGERQKELDVQHLKLNQTSCRLHAQGSHPQSQPSKPKRVSRQTTPSLVESCPPPNRTSYIAVQWSTRIFLNRVPPPNNDRAWREAWFQRLKTLGRTVFDVDARNLSIHDRGRDQCAAQLERITNKVRRALASAQLGNQIAAQANLQWRRIKG